MAQQTSVEFMVEILRNYDGNLVQWLDKEIEQAKEMHKNEVITAHKEGNKYNGWALPHEHEQYYNKTFKTK
jgi:hypothetical protein